MLEEMKSQRRSQWWPEEPEDRVRVMSIESLLCCALFENAHGLAVQILTKLQAAEYLNDPYFGDEAIEAQRSLH